MSLTWRRNYPVMLVLIAFLAFLMLAVGDQPLVAYSMDDAAYQLVHAVPEITLWESQLLSSLQTLLAGVDFGLLF